MRGIVLKYDDGSGSGLISNDDGVRYSFKRSDLQQLRPITSGTRVDFVPSAGAATEVFIIDASGAIASGSEPGFASGGYTPAGTAVAVAYTGEDLDLWDYFKKAMGKSFSGEGRARRKEFWAFQLFSFLIGFLVGLPIGFLFGFVLSAFNLAPSIGAAGYWVAVFSYLLFVPANITVSIRRLHDIGLSGWLYLLVLVPYLGVIFLFVCALIPSQARVNKHGPIPKPTTTGHHGSAYKEFQNGRRTGNLDAAMFQTEGASGIAQTERESLSFGDLATAVSGLSLPIDAYTDQSASSKEPDNQLSSPASPTNNGLHTGIGPLLTNATAKPTRSASGTSNFISGSGIVFAAVVFLFLALSLSVVSVGREATVWGIANSIPGPLRPTVATALRGVTAPTAWAGEALGIRFGPVATMEDLWSCTSLECVHEKERYLPEKSLSGFRGSLRVDSADQSACVFEASLPSDVVLPTQLGLEFSASGQSNREFVIASVFQLEPSSTASSGLAFDVGSAGCRFASDNASRFAWALLWAKGFETGSAYERASLQVASDDEPEAYSDITPSAKRAQWFEQCNIWASTIARGLFLQDRCGGEFPQFARPIKRLYDSACSGVLSEEEASSVFATSLDEGRGAVGRYSEGRICEAFATDADSFLYGYDDIGESGRLPSELAVTSASDGSQSNVPPVVEPLPPNLAASEGSQSDVTPAVKPAPPALPAVRPKADPNRFSRLLVDDYPAGAMRKKQEGDVTLSMCMSVDGRASDVKVIKSSGVDSLDEAAVNGIPKLRFQPARDSAGKPVAWCPPIYPPYTMILSWKLPE
jgi:TonB family protein